MRDATFTDHRLSPRREQRRRAQAAPGLLTFIGGLVVIALTATWATRSVFNAFESDQFVEVSWLLVTSGGFAFAFSIAAIGYGSLVSRHVLGRPISVPISLGLGWAVLLWGQHAFGAMGLFQTGRWHAWAWMWPLIGILAAIAVMIRSLTDPRVAPDIVLDDEVDSEGAPAVVDANLASALGMTEAGGYGLMWWLTACPVIALLLVAATNAPGWLWSSEAYGYDVLSYHLQLPKEWYELGSITSLEHNVYSFLPSYVEAAYYHVMCLYGVFGEPVYAAVPCQLIHVMLTLITGLAVADLVRVTTRSTIAAAIAGATFIALPWTLVVGSMAYNEMAAMLMLVTGLRVSLEREIPSGRVGLILGLVGGIACGAKLTSIGFVVIPTFVVALVLRSPRQWAALTIMMAVGGVVALAPYFVRNGLACGNPVFPFLADSLGAAHWTAEQVSRWNNAHFVSTNPTDVLGSFVDMALFHEQWALLWWFGAVGAIAAIRFKMRRRMLLAAGLMLVAQVVFWATMTHQQSRFLLPAAIPLILFLGLACPKVTDRHRVVAFIVIFVVACVPISMSVSSLSLFAQQRDGKPATMIAGGVAFRTGDIITRLPNEQQGQHLNMNADAWVNHRTNLEYGIYMLGDATPLYLTRGGVTYHTTWDASPLGDLIREHPGDYRAWTEGLTSQGIRLVLVNHAELYRLSVADGWYDPDVTPEVVEAWTRSETRRIKSWMAGDVPIRSLYRLRTYQGGSEP